MALLTAADLQEEADINGVDISKYSKSRLERIIAATQQEMEEYTGLTFDLKEYTDLFPREYNEALTLMHAPLNSVSEVKVNGDKWDTDMYDVDIEKGLVILNTVGDAYIYDHVPYPPYSVSIKYKAGKSPVDPVAAELCLDIIILRLDLKNYPSGFKSIKEGDISLDFGSGEGLPSDLQARLDKMKRNVLGVIKC